MKYNGIIQRKLAFLDMQLIRIQENLGNIGFDEFTNNWVLRSMAERALQVAVEIVIDVSERILAIEGAGPAASSTETIDKLVALKILDSTEPFKTMVRFRNLVVHHYEEIDPVILYDIAKNKLADFRLFMKQISKNN